MPVETSGLITYIFKKKSKQKNHFLSLCVLVLVKIGLTLCDLSVLIKIWLTLCELSVLVKIGLTLQDLSVLGTRSSEFMLYLDYFIAGLSLLSGHWSFEHSSLKYFFLSVWSVLGTFS